jgi:hypothetical protein
VGGGGLTRRDEIRHKLDKIDELYPDDRLALSRERWTRLWRGVPPLDRYPFHYAPFQLQYYSAGFTPEEWLHSNLDEIIARGVGHDDFIPSFFPGCRQSTIPSMFGAEEIVMNGDYTCNPIISSTEAIDDLPEPSLACGTVAHEWLQMQEFVLEATDGRLPVHVTDMQGPADVCGQLMGYDSFFSCAYEDPDRFQTLMNRVSDAFIGFWNAQKILCGDLFVGTHLFGWNWVPRDAGAALSADSLVMISPAYYKRFYRPYLERISEAFGGVAVHACGDFSPVIPALCSTPGVKAINAGQMTVEALSDAGADGRTVLIGFAAKEDLCPIFQRIGERRLRVDMSIAGVWPIEDGTVKRAENWSREDRADFDRLEAHVTELASSTGQDQ